MESKNKLKVYKVLIYENEIGMRIEGYENVCYTFINKEVALKFAYERALELKEEEKELYYNEDGKYNSKDENYSFDKYSVEVIESTLNFDNEIIDKTYFMTKTKKLLKKR